MVVTSTSITVTCGVIPRLGCELVVHPHRKQGAHSAGQTARGMQCLHTACAPIGSTDSSTAPKRINSGVFHINVWFGIMYYVCLVVQALVGDRHCKLTL